MDGRFKIINETVDLVTSNKIKVVSSRLSTPNGKEVTWGVFDSRDAVVILPLTADNQVYLVKQWRLNRQDFCWEVPSGWVEEEKPTHNQVEVAAARELQEEVGQKPGKLTHLTTMYPTNHFRGKWHIFLAQELSASQLSPDEHEYLEVAKLPFAKAYNRVIVQQIPTAQNLTAFLQVQHLLNLSI